MIAGTIAQLTQPAQKPLESWSQGGQLPALAVSDSQRELHGNSVAQSGTAAGRVNQPELEAGVTREGKIWTETHPTPRDVATEWVADITGAGIIAAESVHGSGDFAFPFDLIMSRCGERVERLAFELDAIAEAWDDSGDLQKQWMIGTDSGNGVSIDYHDNANLVDARDANVGLGFILAWDGTVAKGVLYESGYLAVFEEWTAAMYLRFIQQELLPHSYVPEDEDEEFTQETLDDAGDSGGVA